MVQKRAANFTRRLIWLPVRSAIPAPRVPNTLKLGNLGTRSVLRPHLVFLINHLRHGQHARIDACPLSTSRSPFISKVNWRCASSSVLQINRRTHLYLSTRSEADLWIIEFDFADNCPLYWECPTRTRTRKTQSRYLQPFLK